jgi:hypothetical protein
MSIRWPDQPESPSPVQDLPETTVFSLRMKIGEAGKIKGRSTPVGRLRDLHGGWHGTQRRCARAVIGLNTAPPVAARCAVTAPARQTTLGHLT